MTLNDDQLRITGESGFIMQHSGFECDIPFLVG